MHLLRHAGDQDDPKANALKRRKDKERALLSIDKLKEELKVQNERHKLVMCRLAHAKGGGVAHRAVDIGEQPAAIPPGAHAQGVAVQLAQGPGGNAAPTAETRQERALGRQACA